MIAFTVSSVATATKTHTTTVARLHRARRVINVPSASIAVTMSPYPTISRNSAGTPGPTDVRRVHGERPAGRWDPHERAPMGPAHQVVRGDEVPLGDHVLVPEREVGERFDEHLEQALEPLATLGELGWEVRIVIGAVW